MDSQTQMFLVGALLLVAGAALMWGLTRYGPKLGGVTNVLNTADAAIDGLVTADKAIGPAIIPAPAQAIVAMILGVAQAGVHEAQQLFDSGQITDDQRKDQAVQSAERLLKIAGYTPTPELNAALTGAVEAGVFLMKRQTLNGDASEPPAATIPEEPKAEPVDDSNTEPDKTSAETVTPTVDAAPIEKPATIEPAAVQASAQQVIQNAMLTAASQAKQDLHAAIDQAAQTAAATTVVQ